MKITAKTAAAAFAALSLGACDYARRDTFAPERSEKAYKQAVDNYNAGRIDDAIRDFESAIKSNPGNASARFQLAVLLQDGKNDYLGAICSYRDYILLTPGSDKTAIAKERMEYCKKLLAAEMSKSALENTDIAEELKETKNALEQAKSENGSLAGKLAAAEAKLATTERELEKTKSVLKRMGDIGDEDVRSAPSQTAIAQIPGGDDDDTPRKPEAKIADVQEDDNEPKLNPAMKELFDEEEREEAAAAAANSPAILPADREQSATKLTDLGSRQEDAAKRPVRTFTGGNKRLYTVQEGETLGQIALKFYGRKKDWVRIQDANRATISSDGSVRAGQEIVIP